MNRKLISSWRFDSPALSALVFFLAFVGVDLSRGDQVEAQIAPCTPPIVNPVACENSKPGNPASEWDISGAGDANIEGFAADISVNKGQTVSFKIDTDAFAYRLDIYRMGFYGGMGARKIASILPSVSLPQNQPFCLNESTTGLIDCGNWSVSASWPVPADAVSGIYFAKLVREDGVTGSSHVVFIVRDDSGTSDILFQTSDTTWQAYNRYGGNSLYVGSPAGRAYKVSYNRPFTTRGCCSEDWLFNAEYPMVRWLESNGYNVSYFSGVDSDRRGGQILNHKVFLSVGHDEYWSAAQRANVEAARNAGINLAFFSGNEVFWKTRWENSIDGSGTPYRTLVSYKETQANAKIDPNPAWTGTWRDPRFSPPADGGRPENALTGTIFTVNSGTAAITVPEADGKMRFWRNTSVATLAPGQVATLEGETLGYEWDEDLDNGFRPAGLFRLSSTTVEGVQRLLDYGSTYGVGTATHHLTLYRHNSGALVFGAGTIQWSWGLDGNHDRGSSAPDIRMQQATVNLLADMGVQPDSLKSGLIAATPSTDTTPPTAVITAPAAGSTVVAGSTVTITGTASDSGGGIVGAVEVSVDGGATWRPATGRGSWSFNWTPAAVGSATIRSRAIDDSGHIESPSPGVTVTVGLTQPCPCTIWANAVTPAGTEADPSPVELGVKFRSDTDGFITGLRFYKAPGSTGPHVGKLWTRTGTLLASVTFSNATASGWQQIDLPSPVAISANTTYVASYHTTGYAVNSGYFTSAVSSAPLRALADGEDGPNGVFLYGSGGFPTDTWNAGNYWVDVVFNASVPPDTTPPDVVAVSPTSGATGVSLAANVTATFSEGMNAATITTSTFELRNSSNALVPATVSYDVASRTATLDPSQTLVLGATYTATIRGGTSGVKSSGGSALASDFIWSFTTTNVALPPCPCTIWANAATPAGTEADPSPVELGVKFRSDTDGFITGLRFYKAPGSTGPHVGKLWTSAGALLASVTFTNETASGWQQMSLPTAVAINANTTYVASYHTTGYAVNSGYFTSAVSSAPLRALANGEDGPNGMFLYGSGGFPTDTWNAGNYWVDVVFNTTNAIVPTVVAVSPTSGATGVSLAANVTATFSESMNAATITTSTFELRNSSNALVPATVSYDGTSRTATLDPSQTLVLGATYTATIRGGTSGVKSSGGSALASDFIWSFTTTNVAPPTCPCTIWANAVTPAGTEADPSPVELGVKFRSDTSGFITGLRFYKAPGSTGPHVGKLWTSAGALLASVTFTNETASGWQQMSLPTAVAINANTTYVASYHTTGYAVNSGYFTSAVSSAPLRALANGEDGPNGMFLYGSGGFPTDTWNAGNYWVDVVFNTSVPPDTTPPAVVAVSPTSGATGVSLAANVTATFSEGMNAATITTSTFELRNSSNALVPATVSYDGASRTATLDPSQTLAVGATYTATIRGGTSGVKDAAGNPLAVSFSWSFTATTPQVCPCTIWNSSTVPAVASDSFDQPIELGVKFRTDTDGFVTGLRFYKGVLNSGTHTGNLWTSSGVRLATVTFANETGSGWQEMNFSLPVAVSANTTYVASYHTLVGRYAFDQSYFATSGVSNFPLTALANGQDGPNGVFRIGASGFPTSTFNASNYWVDVVFNTSATLPPDTTAPSVVSVSPSVGATGIDTSASIAVSFSEGIDSVSLNSSTFELRNSSNTVIAAVISYDVSTRTATLNPNNALATSAAYRGTVRGGTNGVKDLAGNAMAADYVWSFSTAAPPPSSPDQGPGGPILVVASASNPFSKYYAEILRAEGLNAFAVVDIAAVTTSILAAYDVVVLGEIPLSNAQVTMFTDWVTGGGNLIAMRPDKKLAGLLGLTDASSTLPNAYLLVNTATAPGVGIIGQTIQYHGIADRYTTNGASTLATLYSTATVGTANPAVTLHSVGTTGGQAAAFTYDLARSIIQTRQGNPSWAGQERDGISPKRSDDMFFGAAAGDSQADWIDLNKVAIPQADEQQRLLANLMIHMNRDKKPLPRFWYLPHGFKAAVLMTGDDHGNNGTAGRWANYIAQSAPDCSVQEWECIRGSSYIYPDTPISDSEASFYQANGFELGVHVTSLCADWTASSLASFYSDQLAQFAGNFPSAVPPATNRTHCIAWSDWATQPKVELANGIRLDTNYYYYPGAWVADRPGFMTGSGMPMRFADLDGTMIDVYQAATQMTDESGQSYPFTVDALLDRALGSEGYYGVFTANMHTDVATIPQDEAIIASAIARNVPVVTARQVLEWLDGRNGSSFSALTWNGSTLSFTVAIGEGANGLYVMLPTMSASGTLSGITLNGTTVPFETATVKGIDYAIFPSALGTYQATYVGQ